MLGIAYFAAAFHSLAASADGSRVLGARIFVLIGWLVGILAASVPLAICELQRDEPGSRTPRS